jgi:hypothetical protein
MIKLCRLIAILCLFCVVIAHAQGTGDPKPAFEAASLKPAGKQFFPGIQQLKGGPGTSAPRSRELGKSLGTNAPCQGI